MLFVDQIKKWGIEIILAQYGHLGLYILPIAQELSIPLVVYFRGYDVYKKGNKLSLASDPTKYKDLFNYSKYCICVSKDIQKLLLKNGCPIEKTIWQPSGADPSFFKIKPSFHRKVIFSLGRFAENKGQHIAIMSFYKLLNKHSDASMIMGGDGLLRKFCEDLVRFLGIENNVIFLGEVDYETVKLYMSKSSVFLHLPVTAEDGDSEGTPNVVMEASASGIPVVATRHGGIVDVIIDGVTGFLVDERDIEATVYYLDILLSDSGLSERLGENGRNHMQDNFTREHNLNVTEIALGIRT
jgi:colanic acid/amylovoran biosynthesis glycosyltransferase